MRSVQLKQTTTKVLTKKEKLMKKACNMFFSGFVFTKWLFFKKRLPSRLFFRSKYAKKLKAKDPVRKKGFFYASTDWLERERSMPLYKLSLKPIVKQHLSLGQMLLNDRLQTKASIYIDETQPQTNPEKIKERKRK